MARFDGRPTRYDWTHVKGTDSKVVATFLDADSNPVDLSGLPITAIAYLPGYPAAAFAFTTVVSGASNSILTVTVADDATLPTRTKDDGTLDWALTIDFAAGRVLPIVAGSFTIVNPGEPDGQYASSDALAVTVTTGDSMAVTVSTVVLAAGIPGIPDGGTAGQALSKVSGTNYDVNWVSVATAAQGAKADTATQPGDLGTAAAQDVAAFATGAEGDLATTATQPEDLGTAAVEDVGAFATAAQGVKADAAAPKASPTFTGDVKIPDGNADGEALAHSQDGAVLKGLTIGGGGTYPRVSIDATIAGYLDFKKSGVGEFYISNGQTGGGRLSIHALAANRHPIEIQADGRLDLDDALSVNVPVPTTTGHALRQGSNATVAALTATGDVLIPDGNADGEALAHSQAGAVLNGLTSTDDVLMTGNVRRLKIGNGTFPGVEFIDSSGVRRGLITLDTAANAVKVLPYNAAGASLGDGVQISTTTGAVTVPVPSATGQALRQGSDATVAALTATGDVTVSKSFASAVLENTNAAGSSTLAFKYAGVSRFYWLHDAPTGGLRLVQRSAADSFERNVLTISTTGDITMAAAPSVTVPVPTTTGQALRWGSNATVAALESTGNVTVSSSAPVLFLSETDQPADGKNWRISPFSGGLTIGSANDALSTTRSFILLRRSTGDTDMSGSTSVTVPAPSASGHAAQVSAIDAATGRLAIGGIEMGDTGWRALSSWTSAGVITGQALSSEFAPRAGEAGGIYIRRTGSSVTLAARSIQANATFPANSTRSLINPFTPNLTGFNAGYSGCRASDNNSSADLIRVQISNSRILMAFATSKTAGNVVVSNNDSGSEVNIVTIPCWDTWPTALPGTAAAIGI